jgi:hypothetical protein
MVLIFFDVLKHHGFGQLGSKNTKEDVANVGAGVAATAKAFFLHGSPLAKFKQG